MTTSYTVRDDPKMLRETLCVAQNVIGNSMPNADRKREHIDRLQRLISECDRHRPIGTDGKHGYRHTATCGCEDISAPTATPGTPMRRAAEAMEDATLRLVGHDLGTTYRDQIARETIYAAFDVEEIAQDLHSLHAEPGDSGTCRDCEFRAGFLLGRLTRLAP